MNLAAAMIMSVTTSQDSRDEAIANMMKRSQLQCEPNISLVNNSTITYQRHEKQHYKMSLLVCFLSLTS